MTTIVDYQVIQSDSAADLTSAVQAQIDLGKASGTVTFTGAPTANDQVVAGAATYTFVVSASTATQVTISATPAVQAANLVAKINAHSTDVVASAVAGVVTIVSAVAGDLPVLTESAANTTVSGAGTLTDTGVHWQPFAGLDVEVGFDIGQLPRHQKLSQAMVQYSA